MGGLVGYESSDEDEDAQAPPTQTKATSTTDQPVPESVSERDINHGIRKLDQSGSVASPFPQPQVLPQPEHSAPSSSVAPPQLGPVQGPAVGPSQGPILGPALGPSLPAIGGGDRASSLSALPQDQPDPPRSPYSATRALIHDLTLPSVPDITIPPSPPGSPPRALTAKFDNFLSLKQTKAIHFNARLAGSAAARNPGLMDKLLGFVGIETSFDGEGGGSEADGGPAEQYATTLPTDIWDPAAFPAWAYKTPLRRAQERATKERERGRGEPVEFVPASAPGAGAGASGGSRGGTPGVTSVPPVTGKRKTRFDM